MNEHRSGPFSTPTASAVDPLTKMMFDHHREIHSASEAHRFALSFLCRLIVSAGIVSNERLEACAEEYAATIRALPIHSPSDVLIAEKLVSEVRSAFGLNPEIPTLT